VLFSEKWPDPRHRPLNPEEVLALRVPDSIENLATYICGWDFIGAVSAMDAAIEKVA